MNTAFILLFSLVSCAVATVYFDEKFNDDAWEDRWVTGKPPGDGVLGPWVHTSGKWYDDAEDKGIQTGEDYRHYSLTAALEKFSNEKRDLVIQYSVKHEQKIDCGGAYIKLIPAGLTQSEFTGSSDYNIMFGPDICGSATKRVHLIFNYNGENHEWKKTLRAEDDELSHLYTLIVRPDQTYEVQIDGEKKEEGSLTDDWDFLEPKTIPDPAQSKPTDWVDDEYIDDPEASKPADWDQPEFIEDPEAEQPDDWDEDLDGSWEAPKIANPDYQGEWKAPRIKNPAYKGVWEHPHIDNPDYKHDDSIYSYEHAFVGFELWQVKAGTIFDDILVTDDVSEAAARAESFKTKAAAEKKMWEELEEERKEAERIAREEEEKKQAEQEIEDEEDAEDDEDIVRDEL